MTMGHWDRPREQRNNDTQTFEWCPTNPQCHLQRLHLKLLATLLYVMTSMISWRVSTSVPPTFAISKPLPLPASSSLPPSTTEPDSRPISCLLDLAGNSTSLKRVFDYWIECQSWSVNGTKIWTLREGQLYLRVTESTWIRSKVYPCQLREENLTQGGSTSSTHCSRVRSVKTKDGFGKLAGGLKRHSPSQPPSSSLLHPRVNNTHRAHWSFHQSSFIFFSFCVPVGWLISERSDAFIVPFQCNFFFQFPFTVVLRCSVTFAHYLCYLPYPNINWYFSSLLDGIILDRY